MTIIKNIIPKYHIVGDAHDCLYPVLGNPAKIGRKHLHADAQIQHQFGNIGPHSAQSRHQHIKDQRSVQNSALPRGGHPAVCRGRKRPNAVKAAVSVLGSSRFSVIFVYIQLYKNSKKARRHSHTRTPAGSFV